ncbi:ATPase [Novimethylophilus kurashikiensis]|uniref:ATPase n=1 Tax=Novimethylophilus kurashikiensis TaxID=1825523 RepID=A0A2R5F882_9PROT|nr:hypothetical protein [Novimethylophilus kurashikiensis]GBG14452.1 ATPase [Novimethylophilus kurashikiensis]
MATAVEQLEQGKKRLESLTVRRQHAQVQLEAGRQQLADAQREAMERYGTADLAELKRILARQEADNERALGEFQTSVAEFEGFISKIEAALADPVAMASLLASMPEQAAPVSPAEAAPAPAFSSEDI